MLKWLKNVFGVNKNHAEEEDYIVELRYLDTVSTRSSLEKALELADRHNNRPATIKGLIKILALRKQAQLMAAVPRQGQDKIPSYSSFNYLLQRMPVSSILESKGEKNIELSKDIVLPWPWAEARFESLHLYGRDVGNPWQFDQTNHRVEWFEPVELGFVSGGNHSIMAGILAGEGILPAENVYNLAKFYLACHLDNECYVYENERFPVIDWDMATILELGRRLNP
ncbi:MAG: hypothetical protein EOP04_08455 [Proteobacteria bacterium]|nr:MAG: hypothetical protein EOP04_08455 [Pseudomonadota bacterium]